jgi:hypothetical protein
VHLLNIKAIFLSLLILPFTAGAQPDGEPLTYVSPVPGSTYIMPGNNIALRHGDPFDPACLGQDLLEVKDSRGDRLPGKIILSDDHRTLIFLPESPYMLGEEITVRLLEGLKTVRGTMIEPLEFNFFITEHLVPVDEAFIDKYILERESGLIKPTGMTRATTGTSLNDPLPAGYPAIEVLVDNDPPPGYYFYAPQDDWNWFDDTDPYLTIVDKYGTPVYYRKLESSGYELKKLTNGLLSFYSFHPFWYHMIMDSAYNIIDQYKMENGYPYTDFHDFQLLDNGHSFVMAYDAQLVDMSQVVPGGNPEAIVTGFVLQELDMSRNVVLQWRSWDHFEITETGPEIDLTGEHIDYVHGNTIEVESDTSILISSRNMHEVTKIHRNTGEIIWRLGGSQNQFTFLGADTLRFNRQHDSRRQSTGEISIFDNGTTRPEPQFSSVPVFDLDTEEMTATLVSRYRHDPDFFGKVMGNAYYTPDSTIVVGWGSFMPGITEIDHAGNVLYELQFDGMNYRAYRFPWETNYFSTDSDSLGFGFIWQEEQVTKAILIANNQDEPISITGYNLHGVDFYVENEFPVIVPAGGQDTLQVTFNPAAPGSYSDVLTINSDINTDELVQRIARQVVLTGNATEGQGTASQAALQVVAAPNPVSDRLLLTFGERLEEVSVMVTDIRGLAVLQKSFDGTASCVLDLDNLADGLYLVEINAGKTGQQGILKIIKTGK